MKQKTLLQNNPNPLITADLSFIPLGVGTSVGTYIQKAYDAMSRVKGITLIPSGMSTSIEASDMNAVFDVVKAGREALVSAGVQRIYMVLKIDDRYDKPHGLEYKKKRMISKT